MKYVGALVLGTFFGVFLIKGEVISWFRIQEMFWFQSFHMYGVIGSAVAIGAISLLIIKRFKIKSVTGEEINPATKPFNKVGNILGGIIFGLGWSMTGACPSPLYALLGYGYWTLGLAVLAAMAGVLVYGLVKSKLPH